MAFDIHYTPPSAGKKETPLLEPGWYNFEVKDAFEKCTEGNPLTTIHGDPFIKLRVVEKTTETSMYYQLFFSEDGSKRINAFLYAVGTIATPGTNVSILPSDFIGKSFRGKVDVSTYNGKQYNQIKVTSPIKAETPQVDEEASREGVDPTEGIDEEYPSREEEEAPF